MEIGRLRVNSLVLTLYTFKAVFFLSIPDVPARFIAFAMVEDRGF
jgi:hypothetical protein